MSKSGMNFLLVSMYSFATSLKRFCTYWFILFLHPHGCYPRLTDHYTPAPRFFPDPFLFRSLTNGCISSQYRDIIKTCNKTLMKDGLFMSEKGKPAKRKHPKRRCINCGHAMTQQFIGLKHCKCGTSWQKGVGYFQRTSDMVFALNRITVGKKKKPKQVPVIRYKPSSETKIEGAAAQ